MIRLISFSYRDNETPTADQVIDCRVFKNPHSVPYLRPRTGQDMLVQQYLKRDFWYVDNKMLPDKAGLEGKTIAFGCVGGKHRSVAMAEMLGENLNKAGFTVSIEHRNLA